MSSNLRIGNPHVQDYSSRMATILAAILLFVLPAAAISETISFEGSWGQAGFNLISQDASGVEVVFSVPSMQITEMELDGEMMQNVIIPGVILPNDAGAPNLAGMGRWIAVPEGAHVEMEVVEFCTEVFHDMNIAPAFEIPRGDYDGPLVYKKDPAIYETDANYPAKPVMMSDGRQMRGVDAVILGITPFQYNPVSKDLTVYKDLRVRLDFIGGTGYFGEDRLRSRWWEPILEQNLLNYSSLPKVDFTIRQTDEDNVEYLIIVPDDPVFIAWADTLKRWRSEQGIITGITTLTEIGGNNATLIENYINNAYATWDPAPVAVLLLSDYQSSGDVYGITSPVWNGYCVSDNLYADIVGSDDLPDLNIARITAQSYGQLSTMINKMLSYEREPYTDPTFYNDPLIAGGWQSDRWFILCCEVIWGYFNVIHGIVPERQYADGPSPPSYWSTNPNTYMIVDYFGPDGLGYIGETPSYLTSWTGTAATINNAINNGTFIVQHRDHGSETGWGSPSYSITNVNQLTNTRYPYVFSINCLTGKFNWSSQCFAEAFHRSQYGALGVMAATEVSYSFVNDAFIWGVYDNMWPDFDPYYPHPGSDPTGEQNLRPGFGNASGKYYLEASSWPYNQGDKDVTYYLFHHHGDAFMTLYSEVPQNLTVQHNSVILGGIGEFTVSANAGSLIGLSVDGEWIGAADGTGAPVTMTINPLTPGQIMRVTVTKANYYRYIADVSVIPPSGPWVTFDNVVIDDDLLGNNNGLLDFGETSHLTISAENIGIATATNVTLNISSSDPLLSILDGTEYVGNIAAGAIATADHGFSVELDASVEDGHIIPMTLQAVSDTTWESNFAIIAHAPEGQYVSNIISDPPPGNQNGNLDPGESGTITVIVINEGSSTVPNLMVGLSTTDPYVTVTAASINVGTLAPGGTGQGTWNISASSACPQEHDATLDLAFSGGGYSGSDGFEITIGDVLYAPTGPDNYGYSAYDPFDAPETPVYDWVEISADSGGPGTLINITTDDTTFYFGLPFTFQYYGVDYDTFTVAANGWIGMGRVVGDDYSNSAIPNSDGPAPMIAPYWEDLSPQRSNSGKVWRWYDATNHRLIVEYNHVEQYAPTGAFETFQVILLDPAFYSTSTGDGRILFQYKTMSSSAQSEGTVGIENQAENDGLQYLFDGAYDVHAHHIENEFVILFSTPTEAPTLDVALTPYGTPIQIPAIGGSFDFNIEIANNGTSPAVCDVWCDVTLPNGSPYGPVLGPANLTLPGGFIGDRDRTQAVPAVAPSGNYMYNAYIGNYPSVIFDQDSFPFEKMTAGQGLPVTEWANTGESFDDWLTSSISAPIPEAYSLGQNYPNPFNPLTTISFALPEAAHVELAVFDLQGRIVSELVNGLRDAGLHEVSWDASDLSSGLYFYRIQAGDYSAVKKMVLMK